MDRQAATRRLAALARTNWMAVLPAEAVAVFCAHVCDPRYGCAAEREQRVGARPMPVVHEWNTTLHVAKVICGHRRDLGMTGVDGELQRHPCASITSIILIR